MFRSISSILRKTRHAPISIIGHHLCCILPFLFPLRCILLSSRETDALLMEWKRADAEK